MRPPPPTPRSVDIHSLGPQGDGIHGGGNKTLFVAQTLPGEKVTVRVHQDPNGLSRGEVIEVVTPSPHRQVPPCPHFSRCGNCTLQHTSETYYHEWKVQQVRNALDRVKVRPRTWLKPLFLGPGLRRRATFSAKRTGDKFYLGYFERRSQTIVDVTQCAVVTPQIFSCQKILRDFLPQLLTGSQSVDFFFQQRGTQVELTVTGALEMPKGEKTLRTLARDCGISGVYWRVDYESTFKRVFREDRFQGKFGPLTVNLPPGAFLQPTAEGESALVEAVLTALPTKGQFADLFAGCGTFSGPMLERASVEAFENDPPSVNSLSQAVGSLPLKVTRRDLQAFPLTARHLSQYDAVVLDPPRAGCLEQVTTIAKSKVPLVVSVSCNPLTFARDAKILVSGGYRLESLKIVDQFYWSHHIELVGKFIR